MFSLIKSGMATAMHELSVVSNNIANANSNGFKKTLVAFSELGDRFGSEQVDSAKVGCDISDLKSDSIKLKAIMNTTQAGVTPELDEWNVTWTTKYTSIIKGTNETASVDPNILIKV
jgi:flagellar basal body rod protein FlgB